ncbi:hypothetical protein [Burkholderia sp. Ac-20379]|uniref:hypothetical protein n=1 Tax=Burkholderia sp. Ac-20379 TaxID=2703900 RepID=UPI00197F4967|nr:hypothetical protein [Burkholderia sp. Ac-20379]MBN3725211.1 hypothetical protein [Burkholderia sp. Ac-20379]
MQTVDKNLNHIQVHLMSCADGSGDGGKLFLSISMRNQKKINRQLNYEGSGFVPTIDTEIAFGSRDFQGIGIGTGAGRDGDGMHYFVIKNDDLIDLGEVPQLQKNSFDDGMYSALTTSSGDKYQSVRYFYKVLNGKLSAVKAVGFDASRGNYVYFINIDSSGRESVLKEQQLSQDEFVRCQSGTDACWNQK